MFPMFITDGENVKVEIPSMVGICPRSIDITVEELIVFTTTCAMALRSSFHFWKPGRKIN